MKMVKPIKTPIQNQTRLTLLDNRFLTLSIKTTQKSFLTLLGLSPKRSSSPLFLKLRTIGTEHFPELGILTTTKNNIANDDRWRFPAISDQSKPRYLNGDLSHTSQTITQLFPPKFLLNYTLLLKSNHAQFRPTFHQIQNNFMFLSVSFASASSNLFYLSVPHVYILEVVRLYLVSKLEIVSLGFSF